LSLSKQQAHSRFQSNNVAKELALIPLLVAHLATTVDHLDGHHPLIRSEVDLTGEIVDVLNEAGHDLSQSWVCLWAGSVDDHLSELLAKADGALAIGSLL